MQRANEHVPQGGAKKTPTTFSARSHDIIKSCPEVQDKSATLQVETAFVLMWSTPKLEVNPIAFKHAVTRELPQKISMTTGSFVHFFMRFVWKRFYILRPLEKFGLCLGSMQGLNIGKFAFQVVLRKRKSILCICDAHMIGF